MPSDKFPAQEVAAIAAVIGIVIAAASLFYQHEANERETKKMQWEEEKHKQAQAQPISGRYLVRDDTVKDTKTGLVWQRAASAKEYNWEDAKNYCNNLHLGGLGLVLVVVS